MKKTKLKKKIKKIEDIGVRAIKTFIQGFLSSLIITIPTSDLSQEGVVKSILIGALASAISYLMNYFNNLIIKESE